MRKLRKPMPIHRAARCRPLATLKHMPSALSVTDKEGAVNALPL
ncbi:hypothetical protein ACVWXM_009559 [Bradyrhizobium sp. GM7.3]